jgi:hypothetical protein
MGLIMSYKEQLYRNALDCIENIYRKSMYDKEVDLYRSFDIINSVNDNQIASKEWLIEKLLPFIDSNTNKICILGGWYGLTALMLSENISENIIIHSVDIDNVCEKKGKMLTQKYSNIYFETDDALNWFFDRPRSCQVIINTSCEHMEPEDIELMIGMKHKDAIVCFQGNNYHDVQSHINTHDTLDDFVDSLKLKEVLYKESLPAPSGKYDRFMVIGR